MKRHAVLLGEHGKHAISSVYAGGTMEELKQLVELYPDVIDKNNVEQHREAAARAEFAFSTWGMCAFTSDEIRTYFPRLKAVFYAAGSVQGFARPFLDCGVDVFSAWAANAVPVAEFAAAQILLANKGYFQAMATYRRSRNYDEARSYSVRHPGNYGTRIGILGAGMIGRKVIELLKPNRLDIAVFDPFLPDEKAKEMNVLKTDLEYIFTHCHTISNHLANNAQTKGMLNKKYFRLMQPYATFINTGRGAQVVEADLIEALKEVPTRTALLDVTDPEPAAEDSEWHKLDNVFLTPHIAGSQGHEVIRMAQYMIDECRRYLTDQPLRYRVTRDMLATMA